MSPVSLDEQVHEVVQEGNDEVARWSIKTFDESSAWRIRAT